MARRTVIAFVDDLDGKDLKDAVTITFSIGNKSYEFDTSQAHAKQFHSELEKYVAVSRPAGTRRARAKGLARGASRDAKAVREWARENGYEISDRGRVAAEIIEAYEAAN